MAPPPVTLLDFCNVGQTSATSGPHAALDELVYSKPRKYVAPAPPPGEKAMSERQTSLSRIHLPGKKQLHVQLRGVAVKRVARTRSYMHTVVLEAPQAALQWLNHLDDVTLSCIRGSTAAWFGADMPCTLIEEYYRGCVAADRTLAAVARLSLDGTELSDVIQGAEGQAVPLDVTLRLLGVQFRPQLVNVVWRVVTAVPSKAALDPEPAAEPAPALPSAADDMCWLNLEHLDPDLSDDECYDEPEPECYDGLTEPSAACEDADVRGEGAAFALGRGDDDDDAATVDERTAMLRQDIRAQVMESVMAQTAALSELQAIQGDVENTTDERVLLKLQQRLQSLQYREVQAACAAGLNECMQAEEAEDADEADEADVHTVEVTLMPHKKDVGAQQCKTERRTKCGNSKTKEFDS